MGKIKNFFGKYNIEFMVAVFLIYSIYIDRADEIYSYVNPWYVIDYSYGFGSRLVIGSLMHFFQGEVVTERFAYHFIVGALVLLSVLLAFLVGAAYKRLEKAGAKRALLFMAVFYLASPASPAYLWTCENMGRLDAYLFILTLLMVTVSLKIQNTYIKYAVLTALGVLAVAVHQVYVFIFFPSLLVIILQDVWREKNKGRGRKCSLCALAAVVIIAVSFLYMQFGSGIYYDSAAELMEELNKHANFVVDSGPMEAEYFWTIEDHFYKNMVPEIPHHLKYGFMLVCMLAPVWVLYLWIWIKIVQRGKGERLKYILMMFTNLAYVPVFVLMNDWGRWFAAFFSVAFINIVALAADRDETTEEVLCVLGDALCKNAAFFILIVLYISTFEKFEGLNFPEQVTCFYYTTYHIKTWLTSY